MLPPFDVGTLSSTITIDAEECFTAASSATTDPASELKQAEATLDSISAAVRSFMFEARRSSAHTPRCPALICYAFAVVRVLFQVALSCVQAILLIWFCSYLTDVIHGDDKDDTSVANATLHPSSSSSSFIDDDDHLASMANKVSADIWGVQDPDDSSTLLSSRGALAAEILMRHMPACWLGLPWCQFLLFLALWPVPVVEIHGFSILNIIQEAMSNIFSLLSLIINAQAKLLAAVSDVRWGDSGVMLLRLATWWYIMNPHQSQRMWCKLVDLDSCALIEHAHYAKMYDIVKSTLLVIFAWRVFGAMGQLALAYLLLRSHHKNAAIGMQETLLEETTLRRLTKMTVGSQDEYAAIPEGSHLRGRLAGVNSAHWQAIRFLMRFRDICDDIMARSEEEQEDLNAKCDMLRNRAHDLANVLCEFLADRLNQARVRQSLVRRIFCRPRPGKTNVSAAYIKEQARQSMPHREAHNSVQVEEDSTFVFHTSAEKVVKAIGELQESQLSIQRVSAWLTTLLPCTCAPQPEGDLVIKKSFMVSFMKAYLRNNPYIQVQVLESLPDGRVDGILRTDVITDMYSAMRLGYCIFFRIKAIHYDTSVSIRDKDFLSLPSRDTESHTNDDALDLKGLAMKLDRDGNGVITLQEFVDTAKAVHRKRQQVGDAVLGDIAAVRQVNFAVDVAVVLATFFVLMFLMFPSQLQMAWTTLTVGAAIISVIFASTIREQSEAVMYYFMTRPFTIGDDITYDGARYTVNSMTLLSVELIRYDGTIVTIPTNELRRTHVHNLTRSGETQVEIRFKVEAPCTRDELREILNNVSDRVKECTKQHCRLYHGPYTVWLSQDEDDVYVCAAIELRNKGKDIILTKAAKTIIYEAIWEAFKLGRSAEERGGVLS